MMPLVPPGARIAVVAPSGAYDHDRLEAGLSLARARGWNMICMPGMLQPHRYLAAPDHIRHSQLMDALTSPDYDAVWAARGGYGVTRLLPGLSWQDLPPRPVIGFSDLTPLLELLRRRVGSPVVHGPVLHSLQTTSDATREQFFALLEGRQTAPLRGDVWVEGQASGPLVGGNLAMIAATAGTPFAIDARDAVLLLEDVGEPAYRIDRLLQQLRSSGVFDHIAAVALGTFTSCRVPPGVPWTLEEILREHVCSLGVPVLANLPFGHGPDNVGLPLGRRAHVSDGMLSWDVPVT